MQLNSQSLISLRNSHVDDPAHDPAEPNERPMSSDLARGFPHTLDDSEGSESLIGLGRCSGTGGARGGAGGGGERNRLRVA